MGLSEKDLNLGDHIYVRRLLYSHHGIYAGDGNVIHYTGEEKEKKDPLVRETIIEDFLKGGKLRRRNYKKHLPPSETLSFAIGNQLRLIGFGFILVILAIFLPRGLISLVKRRQDLKFKGFPSEGASEMVIPDFK